MNIFDQTCNQILAEYSDIQTTVTSAYHAAPNQSNIIPKQNDPDEVKRQQLLHTKMVARGKRAQDFNVLPQQEKQRIMAEIEQEIKVAAGGIKPPAAPVNSTLTSVKI